MQVFPAPISSAAYAACHFLQALVEAGMDIFAMDSGGRSLLFCACANNRPGCVSLILELDVECTLLDYPDKRGDSPLHAAACNGHLECVRKLLDGGADVSAVNAQQLTPSILAHANAHVACHDVLVEYVMTFLLSDARKRYLTNLAFLAQLRC